MEELTQQEQQRLWKKYTPPMRKILLWGLDSQKNPCLLILYGEQKFEREIKYSPRSYYADAYILEKDAEYTHYAVFHGINGHLPSIPNVYFSKQNNLFCYKRGYKTAKREWKYDKKTGWNVIFEIDEKYAIKDFYEIKPAVKFNYYEQNTYSDYVSFFKKNNFKFEDFELIEEPSTLFGFETDSAYYDIIINMFSRERLYTRRKYLSRFMKMQPSVEEYQRILKVASVELACGIFQNLTEKRDPILLEDAEKIYNSDLLWAKEGYNKGLKRCIKQYISFFSEELINEQKEFIYKTLPEMDFNIKYLKLYKGALKGQELADYLNRPYAYYNLLHEYVYGNQKLYEKNNYTDGKNVYNIKYKNTIQTAKAYGMADVIGKIAYYLDAPRTKYYFIGSRRTSAYNYYVRYIKRVLDEYKIKDEEKFINAVREMLTSYTDNDNSNYYYDDTLGGNYFFGMYFVHTKNNNKITIDQIWDNHIEDVVYIVKNAKAYSVFIFCHHILKKAYKQHKFDSYDIKELIELAQISFEDTAELFEKILFPKLDALTEFDADIMIALMNSRSELLQDRANKYFERTNGRFKPKDIVNLLSLNNAEKWYSVLESCINGFAAKEYIEFIKVFTDFFADKETVFSEKITELLQNSVGKLDSLPAEDKQELIGNFVALILRGTKISGFVAETIESIIFSMSYDDLKIILNDIDLKYSQITERSYNIAALLKAIKEDIVPKDSVILSVLDTGSSKLVKMLTEITDKLQSSLKGKTTTLLLLSECNVYPLNKIAQNIFEGMDIAEREKLHMILLDSPVEKTYEYGLCKLDEWYGDKTPEKFIVRMLEHPCIAVKAYLSKKMETAFSNLEYVQPDLYVYYAKTLLYLPNKATKSKEYIYSTMPEFLRYYPEKRNEIEYMLLDIGSTGSRINSERALVAFAQIQKEVCSL